VSSCFVFLSTKASYKGLLCFHFGIFARLCPFGGARFSETANNGGATLRTGCGESHSQSEQLLFSLFKEILAYGGPYVYVVYCFCFVVAAAAAVVVLWLFVALEGRMVPSWENREVRTRGRG